MIYAKLPGTDLEVSKICLGTMTFGHQNTIEDAHRQLDYALDNGVNFVDTAEIYPVPVSAETKFRTETYIGEWLEKSGNRDKVILATKVAPASTGFKYIRGGPKATPEQFRTALEDSLRRLKTDYVDLYQLHWPARHVPLFGGYTYDVQADQEEGTNFVEQWQALTDMVQEGKIRHLGVSNETPWGLGNWSRISKELGSPCRTVQNAYSLLNRTYEPYGVEAGARGDIGLLAYSPLAMGYLTGKYMNGIPERSRGGECPQLLGRYQDKVGLEEAVSAYHKIAEEAGLSLTSLSLAFVNTRPFVTSNIIGATTMEQLEENISSYKIELSPDILEKIEAVHLKHSNPTP